MWIGRSGKAIGGVGFAFSMSKQDQARMGSPFIVQWAISNGFRLRRADAAWCRP
jgi:hypothetical protein